MKNNRLENKSTDTAFFSEEFLQAQREILEKKKEELEAALANRGHKVNHGRETFAASFDDLGSDQDSNIAEVESYEANLATVSALKSEHERVLSALERLGNGTYGLDTKTEQPIRQERLKAFPAAEFDINGEKS